MNWSLATEDPLSEAVGVRLLHEQGVVPSQRLRRDGFGYLKTKARSWQQIAQRSPVLLLTDLDRASCAPTLRSDWFGEKELSPWLCFRVAVREIEAWLLADHTAIQRLLVRRCALPDAPEALPDPKQHLLVLARKAPRPLRHDLVRNEEGEPRQAPGYNARLAAWVGNEWDPARAAERAPSLKRTRERVAEFVARARASEP